MEVFVDDSQVDGDFIADHTLEDALRHVQSNLCAPDQVVVGLRCDGEDVPPNGMADALKKSALTFNRLEVFTSKRERLILDAMSQALAALGDTETACQRIAGLLTEGKTVEGVQALGECLGIWQKIHEAVTHSIQMLELDPEQIAVGNESLVHVLCRPKEVLLRVKQALQSQDYVLLSDIMQYEFGEVTQQWHNVIDVLQRRANDPAE